MKNYLHILLLLLLPFWGVAQQTNLKDTIPQEETIYKNRFDVGVEVLATSFSYTRRINDKIRVGAGLGLGFGLGFGSYFVNDPRQSSFSLEDGVLEIAHIGATIEFKLNQYLYYEFKPQSVILTKGELGDSFSANGVKNGLFIRTGRVKIGTNIFIGQAASGKWLFTILPLQLKIPLGASSKKTNPTIKKLESLPFREKTTYKHQLDVGIELVKTSFSYTRSVNHTLRVGASFGFIGAVVFGATYSKDAGVQFQDIAAETIHIGPVFEFKLTPKLLYEFKPQMTVFDGFSTTGLKNGLYVQLKRVKLGCNVFVGRSHHHSGGHWSFYINPLQLKIPIQW